MRPKGFTLLELVVVTGIICLLVALIAPALLDARRAARSSQCLSNLKQLGITVLSYSDLHSGYLPPTYIRCDNSWNYWFANIGDDRVANVGQFGEYPLTCPEVPEWATKDYQNLTGGYGLNEDLSEHLPGLTWVPTKLRSIRELSKTPIMADSAQNYLFPTVGYKMIECPIWSPFSKTTHFRHVGRHANVLYLDGHAVSIESSGFEIGGIL